MKGTLSIRDLRHCVREDELLLRISVKNLSRDTVCFLFLDILKEIDMNLQDICFEADLFSRRDSSKIFLTFFFPENYRKSKKQVKKKIVSSIFKVKDEYRTRELIS